MVCAGEFIMADDAFALSPISARATEPREQDYEAIGKAFMETSRGRWFLAEYAKRNRNVDIRMVLDAVARIEANQAARKSPASDGALAEALAAIRNAVDEARASALAALAGSAQEESLAPIRNSARVIRELSSRWRKIGADGRICDRLDAQVSAIEAGCGQIASTDPALALSAAFDLIRARIAEFDEGDTSSPPPTEEAVALPEPRDEAPAITPETDDDDAVLDRIAFEMAADDPSDAGDLSVTGETPVARPPLAAPEVIAAMPEPIVAAAPEPPPAAPEIIAEAPEPIAAPAPPAMIPPPLPQPSSQPSSQPSPQPSLGAALLASGILRMPNAPASGPLAPIRRMTQAEKIAFFS
jgi:hypothetical protein